MKKLLSSALILTLSFNSTVGYCESADVGTQTSSTEINSTVKTNANSSYTSSEHTNIEIEDANQSSSFTSYLKSKIEEKKNNQIAEHKKELQLLQNMNTKQYFINKLKKFMFTAAIFLAFCSAITVPWVIYVAKKSNELITQAEQAALNKYFESSDLLKSIKTFADKIQKDFRDNDSIVAQTLVNASKKLLDDFLKFKPKQ